MSDLFDELESNASGNVGLTVHQLGGDLFDELAVKERKPGDLSDAMKSQAVTDARREMVMTLNDDLSTFDKFRVGTGRGLATIGRAVGAVEPEDPAVTGAFQTLKKGPPAPTQVPLPGGGMVPVGGSSMAGFGELVGEALPFLPAGVGLSQLPKLGARVLASMGLGAAEGAAIIRGQGGSGVETAIGAGIGGAMGGVGEAFVPYLIGLGRRVFDRLKRTPEGPLLTIEGGPTPEFQAALDETGTTFEELAGDAYTKVNQPGVNPQQAARASRFESQGIPYTEGDVTQKFQTQAREQRLAGSASDEAGEAYRQVRLQQSDAFQASVNRLIDDLGVPAETGATLKAALAGRKKILQTEKNALYKQVAEANPEVANLPLFTDSLLEGMPDAAKRRRLARLAPQQTDAVDDLLVEFGIEKSDEAVKAFVESGGEITPLSLGNFEDFRAAVNLIERSDTTGAVKNITGPLKRALDAEATLIDDAVKNSGLDDVGILDTLKAARERVRTLKTEFDPQEITGKLIAMKRNGYTEVLEASKVSNELLRPGAPVEYLERTMQSLRKAGTKGEQAIGHLRATTVLNALENSLKATGRKIDGNPTVGGNAFAKYLQDTVGEDKLRVLFQGAEGDLAKLLNLKQTALDMTATNAAIPKGSADVNADIVRAVTSMGFMSGALGQVGAMFKAVLKPAINARATRRAITFTPEVQLAANEFVKQFPAMASALGIAAVATSNEKDTRP